MSAPIRVFLAGEGNNDLGGRSGSQVYDNPQRPGVLEALLRRIRENGWEIGGACQWKNIRKYKAHGAVDADAQAVLGAALDAREALCQILAFCRDRDKDENRAAAITKGMEKIDDSLTVIGGLAIPTLEGWILALLGQAKTESLTPKQAVKRLVELGVGEKDTDAMVQVTENADLDQVPKDAVSLQNWLKQAETAMMRHGL